MQTLQAVIDKVNALCHQAAETCAKSSEETSAEAWTAVSDVCFELMDAYAEALNPENEIADTGKVRLLIQHVGASQKLFNNWQWVSGLVPSSQNDMVAWERPKHPLGDMIDTIIAPMKEYKKAQKGAFDAKVTEIEEAIFLNVQKISNEAEARLKECKRYRWRNPKDEYDTEYVKDDDGIEKLKTKTASTRSKVVLAPLERDKSLLQNVADNLINYSGSLYLIFSLRQAVFEYQEFRVSTGFL